MKKIKVKMNDMEDLIFMNETMIKYPNLNFDVQSGMINLDGKSLIGLLALGVSTFDIRITGGKREDIDLFVNEVSRYII